MHLRNLELYITSGGARLSEHQVTVNESTKTTTCFIPSQAGKKFEINWRPSINDAISVKCCIDGRFMGSSFSSARKSGSRFGVRSSPTKRLPYTFSELVLVDDESAIVNDSVLSKLGTIEVTVTRSVRVPSPWDQNPAWQSKPPTNIGPLHEKSKKVGGHCVTLGAALPCAPEPRSHSAPLDSAEGYWAKFIFQYRPEGILRAQGLLEPKNITSSSRSRNLKRSRSSTFKVESSAKVPARSESSHPRKRVKLERQQAIDLTVVKHEDSGPPRLLDPSLRGTVIDLTLDDD